MDLQNNENNMKKTYKKPNLSILSHQVETVILANSNKPRGSAPQFCDDPADWNISVDARAGQYDFDW